MPCASPARSPAPSMSAVSPASVNRRDPPGSALGTPPALPSPLAAASSCRACSYRPASARCSTAATALAVSTLTVAPGRSTRAIAAIAAAGESTYSSTL